MAGILRFPQKHEILYKQYEPGVEARILALGHDAELSERIRKEVMVVVKKYCNHRDFHVVVYGANSGDEADQKAISLAISETVEEFIERLGEMLTEIVLLKIQLCEHEYVLEK